VGIDSVPSTLECSRLVSRASCACATTWPKKLGDVVLHHRARFLENVLWSKRKSRS
jgi:hypothetical protein